MPSLIVSYAHTEHDIERTIEGTIEAHYIYKKHWMRVLVNTLKGELFSQCFENMSELILLEVSE